MNLNPIKLKIQLYLYISLFVFLSTMFIQAQNRYVIPCIRNPIQLDGLSDESVWQDITPLPMVMHSPIFGNTPTEQTELLVTYDDHYLYVAGRCYDSDPAGIQSTS